MQEDPYRATEARLVELEQAVEPRRPQSTAIKVLRWLAVVPAAIGGFYFAVIVGVIISILLSIACGPIRETDGFCSAPWYGPAVNIALCACAAIAAFLVVVLPALAAPSLKRPVSWAAYATGAAITIYVALEGRSAVSYAASACALLAGLAAVWMVWRRTRHAGSKR